ncbi:MAG: ImmA/IrrE family metallo-endopeptidase [Candidatus Marinimicrobia bacterium]|nr:ImmA/IrrE family metallo-endopeptidase [Candidatus Neomarinimicrobiota bacterium]MCH7762404.1 ImmA/IrrE family metallo-endopeptidase [Candidatus Neomarinimicrobiota bacterium]
MNEKKIPVNPLVLKWARETAGLDVMELALRMKKHEETIIEWEKGISTPTYPQLEKLAYTIFKRPIALFFFPEPPKELYPENSFRTLPDSEIDKLPPYFLKLFRHAQALQINLSELSDNRNPAQQNILKDLMFSSNMSHLKIAQEIRAYLKIDLNMQKSIRNTDDAFKLWRNAIEEKGIFIFKDAFKNDDISGFCIYDEVFPIIYINNSLPKTRQIFTIFHELAHLLFKTGGIDQNNIDYFKLLSGSDKQIEILCNKVSASFLVPNVDFRKQIRNLDITEENISNLAGSYCVSREVILRKYLDLNLINKAQYNAYSAKWNNEAKEIQAQKKKKPGGNPYATKAAYLGDNYLKLVFKKYYQNIISQDQLASYIGMKADKVLNIEPFLYKEGMVV